MFVNIFQKFFPKQSIVLLGRWKLHNCPKSINIKIDSSNTDHCGTCSFTNNNKLVSTNSQDKMFEDTINTFFKSGINKN
jgi:hypothetical protein